MAWPSTQTRCSSNFQRFHSSDTLRVTEVSQLTWKKIEAVKENGNPPECKNDEKLPRIDELPQLVQPMTSWIKWSTQVNMQTERGIPAYRSLWDCLSSMQGGNFQEHHPSLLQPQVTYNSTDRCIEERTWSCVTTKFYSGNVCLKSIDWKWEELSELGVRVSCNNLGNGKVPLLPVWQAVHIGDWPETIGGDLQEAHGGNLS